MRHIKRQIECSQQLIAGICEPYQGYERNEGPDEHKERSREKISDGCARQHRNVDGTRMRAERHGQVDNKRVFDHEEGAAKPNNVYSVTPDRLLAVP